MLQVEHKKFLTALFLTAAAMMFFASACGKKGPPTAPRPEKPAPAVNLEAVERDNVLVLQWQLPEGWRSDYTRPEGFSVQRALTDLEDDCPDCPVRFLQIGKVDFQHGRTVSDKWHFSDEIQANTVHRYQIVSYGAKGEGAEPSNTVVIRSDAKSGS